MTKALRLPALDTVLKVGVALCAFAFGCLGVALATGIHEYAVAALLVLVWLGWRFLPAKHREMRWMGFGSKHALDEARSVRRKRLGIRRYEQLRDSAFSDLREERRKSGASVSSRPPSPASVEDTLQFELALRGAAMVLGIDAGLRRPGGPKKDAFYEKRLQARAYEFLHRNDSAPAKPRAEDGDAVRAFVRF